MIGYVILGIFALLLAVILIRAACFNPKPQKAVSQEEVTFDREKAIDALQQLVRCKTISYNDHSQEDEAEFRKLIDLLPSLYPKVFDACSFQLIYDTHCQRNFRSDNSQVDGIFFSPSTDTFDIFCFNIYAYSIFSDSGISRSAV